MLTRIEAGEGRPIAALMAINALSGIANCLVMSVAFGLFFQRFEAEQLALVYVANAGIIVAASALFLRLTWRLPIGTALTGLSGCLAAIAWIVALALQAGAPDALVFCLPILFQAMFVLGNLVIWSLAGRLFDVRQGRRLFGLVNTGYWIGAVGIGLLVKPMTALLGMAGAVLPAALAATGAALGMALATRRYRDRLGEAAATRQTKAPPATAALRDGHALLVFAVTACVWLAFYVIDNIFYERAHAIYPDPADLSGFIGLYMAANGAVTIALTAIGSGPIIQALGVPRALLATPLLLTLLCAVMAVSGLSAGEGLLLFVLGALTRLADVAALGAVNQPAMNLTYQPLPAGLRTSVQTIAEGIVQPLAIGLSGLLLLWLRQGLGAQSTMLALVACAVLGAWALCADGLGRSYRRRFAALLKARAYDTSGDQKLPIDRAAIAALQDAARTGSAPAALYAVEVLLQQAPLALLGLLPDLARHPAAELRLAILPHLAQADPELLRLLATADPAPKVRQAALTQLAESAGRADPMVAAALDGPEAVAALRGIAHRAGAEDARYVADRVTAWLASPDTASRCAALELVGVAQLAGFDSALRAALADAEAAVRNAAIESCASWQLPGFWPDVAARLDEPRDRRAAMRALASAGAAAVPALAAASRDPAIGPAARRAACNLLGRAGNTEAVQVLWTLLEARDDALRLAALQGLTRIGPRLNDAAEDRRAAALAREVEEAGAIARARAAAADETPLAKALDSALGAARRRILLLLGLGGDPAAMARAMKLLEGGGDAEHRGRAVALELVEMWAPPALRARILDVWTGADMVPADQAAGIAAALLRDPPAWADGWILACALEEATAPPEQLTLWASSPDPALRDAARRALLRAGNTSIDQRELAMVSVVERVLLLKSSNFFAGVPEALLSGIAASLEERRVLAGDIIVAEGSVEQAMYVVARGRVEVRHGAAVVAVLEAGEVFGELALLDPAPRSADVAAAEDSLLLRLDGAAFQDLLADHGDMAAAIIRELVQRLRATSARLH